MTASPTGIAWEPKEARRRRQLWLTGGAPPPPSVRRLLEAATEVFLETSPMLASLDTIAARAGVARPALLFHFGSRAELMDQVGQYHLERYRAAACEFEPGELRPFLEAYLGAQRSRRVLAPAPMMVVGRAAQDLTTEREMRDFAAAACELAQAPSTGEVDD